MNASRSLGSVNTGQRRGGLRGTPNLLVTLLLRIRSLIAGRIPFGRLRPRIHRAERSLVAGLTQDEQLDLIGLLAKLQAAAASLSF
jgi:hypothetical protein